MSELAVKRALISVYKKDGLVDFARGLSEAGVEIVSTGSTAKTIAAAGVPVTPVEQVTGFPECLDGRVKTLHPFIHAGILADLRLDSHKQQLAELGVEPFQLVVCNLYPFEETVASGADFQECIEKIDIGGPSMVRAAAKNHANVAVVVNPGEYDEVLAAVRAGGLSEEQRRVLAYEAFAHTAEYDTAITEWFAEQLADTGEDVPGEQDTESDFPPVLLQDYTLAHTLRYGENPHQAAALYLDPLTYGGLAGAEQLGGKEMSYNNYQDVDAAIRAANDHDEPCVAIIKHANPCGIAIAEDVAAAHAAAHACDPVSAYGGVIAVNRTVTAQLAAQVKPIFTEAIAAPDFDPEALEILRPKKNLRILKLDTPAPQECECGPECACGPDCECHGPVAATPENIAYDFKAISGGMLVQERDHIDAKGDDPADWKLVSGQAADPATLRDLKFAWRTIRSVKSNAILLAKDGATVGVGMGQVNRVDSAKLAVERANTLGNRETGDAAAEAEVGGARGGETAGAPQRSRGAVAASDAFFPFADGLQVLIDAGVRAVIHPGGSIRDQEVIDAAQAAGITMYLTGTRHFYH
ncbi:MAG: bifunctional phosphoribosylaminoimidazolecarboxamide formyltransferase/IMP cyclohydrolase [Varibaculum sp.]|nr:bifunctional phosphoribosylaminoimidazolecarboxamide formyltransferase/IMP cyclohydrolase [Varibaculum sp.]